MATERKQYFAKFRPWLNNIANPPLKRLSYGDESDSGPKLITSRERNEMYK